MPRRSLSAAGVSRLGAGKARDHRFNLADRHWLTWGGVKRDFGRLKQVFGMEAGRKTLQPHRRDMPIAIAARALQQIELARRAFKKCGPQLAQQSGIIASSRREGRIKSTVVKRHKRRDKRDRVKAGFIPTRCVVCYAYGRTAPNARLGAQERR